MRETEQDINQPDNQTNQPGSEPAQIEAMGNALHDNVTSLSTCQQLDQVGTRLIDMETNTSDIEVRPWRDGARIIDSNDDVQVSCPHVDVILPSGLNEQTPMPHINLSISRYDPELLRGSHTRAHDTRMQVIIPQLDGPVSIQSRSRGRISENMRLRQESFKGLLHHTEENILVRVVMILIVMGDHIEIEGPLKRKVPRSKWKTTG